MEQCLKSDAVICQQMRFGYLHCYADFTEGHENYITFESYLVYSDVNEMCSIG